MFASSINFSLTVFYMVLMGATFWANRKRPDWSVHIWGIASIVALGLTIGAVLTGVWWIAALWAVNVALDVWNIRLAQRRQRDRELDEFWAKRFQNQH